MKCLRQFFTLFVTFAICFSLCITCFAEDLDDSSDSEQTEASDDVDTSEAEESSDSVSSDIGLVEVEIAPSPSEDDVSADEVSEDSEALEDEEESSGSSGFVATGSLTLASDEPIEVIVIEEDVSYPSVYSSSEDGVDLTIDDDPPTDSPFYGACYVTGYDDTLGYVTVYFPTNYKTGYFGVDADGYLFNVSSSSISGYLEGVYNNSVSVASFSYPRYRTSSSTSNYTYLYLIPESSNMDIATSNAPKVPASDLLPYLTIFLLGGVFLCCMKRS